MQKALIENGKVVNIIEIAKDVDEWDGKQVAPVTLDTRLNGTYVDGVFGPAPVPDYTVLRRSAYGSVEDQLDMIYWDQVNRTTKWKDHITKIKGDHPKPE